MRYLPRIYLLFLLAYCLANERKTAISIKELYRDNRPPICLEARYFLDLTLKSNVFVDKSLLIKELLQDLNRLILISRPRQWGKSVNLDMLKKFLQIPINDDAKQMPPSRSSCFRYFCNGHLLTKQGELENLKTPPLISQHRDIIDQYFGKHPVIHVDFTKLQGNSYEELMSEFITRISDAYKRHSYMVKLYNDTLNDQNTNGIELTLTQRRLYKFTEITNKEVDHVEDLVNSLKFLADILYERFDQLVFLFIDGYDEFFTRILSDINFDVNLTNKFIIFYWRFLHSSFKKNYCLKKGIITGVLPTPKEEFATSLSGIVEYTFLGGELTPYYGIDERELNSIAEYLDLPNDTRSQIESVYGGYQFAKNATKLYNPALVARFASKKSANAAVDVEKMKNFVRFFLRSNRREFYTPFTDLFGDTGAALRVKYLDGGHFTWRELHLLLAALEGFSIDSYQNTFLYFELDRFVHKAIMFLYTFGYLTMTEGFSISPYAPFIQMKCQSASVRKELTVLVQDFIQKSLRSST